MRPLTLNSRTFDGGLNSHIHLIHGLCSDSFDTVVTLCIFCLCLGEGLHIATYMTLLVTVARDSGLLYFLTRPVVNCSLSPGVSL